MASPDRRRKTISTGRDEAGDADFRRFFGFGLDDARLDARTGLTEAREDVVGEKDVRSLTDNNFYVLRGLVI